MNGLRPQRSLWRAMPTLLACAALGLGCVTYSERLDGARHLASAGDYAASVSQINASLGVDTAEQQPTRWGSDRGLGVLERGTLLQALEDYPLSARDFAAADRELELLDIAADPGQVGKYIYSDSAGNYRISATERLSLNSFNLLNYLAQRDLQGASVEARRFTVMRNYLLEFAPQNAHGTLGAYLAGFVFERLGKPDQALRYYDQALAGGPLPSLRGPIESLAQRSSYRGDYLENMLGAPDAAPAEVQTRDSELLVVTAIGRVPRKVPKRIPIGAAVGIAGTFVTGNVNVLKYSVTKVVVYPELAPIDSRLEHARVVIDGRDRPVERTANLAAAIHKEYDALRPRIIGAALSRLIARAALAEGARAAGNQQSAALGTAAALLLEAAAVALDKPDTRSWNFLPGSVYITRVQVPAGVHEIDVVLGGGGASERRRTTVTTQPGGYAVVVVTAPR